ncbi:modular serine protease-like isoform X2 [Drosophila busckii]|nr:modular serine protease-like isoform X2 [Drosophila busckii]
MGNLCDNKYDCTNGRDESLELCLQAEYCPSSSFQCGNGKCLDRNKLCDGSMDCMDGADEMPKVCLEEDHSKNITLREKFTCMEPRHLGLKFRSKTSFHFNGKENFVYANEAAEFECYDASGKFSGNFSNVCNNSGNWHFKLPICSMKPPNLNPDTNGTNGCPIDEYNKDSFVIINSQTLQSAAPPINEMSVRFSCKEGYELKTEVAVGRCEEKKWYPEILNYVRCLKICDESLLYCDDSLQPYSYISAESITITRPREKSIRSGMTVLFDCNVGYGVPKENTMPQPTMKCLPDGTWERSANMKDYCKVRCGYNSGEGLSKSALKVSSTFSQWTVAIYELNEKTLDYEYICSGVLIKMNLVLTAAHCFQDDLNRNPAFYRVGSSTSKLQIVNNTYGRAVLEIQINEAFHYQDSEYDGDTALVRLSIDAVTIEKVICLPEPFGNFKVKPVVGYVGQIITWSTKSNKNEFLDLTMVAANITSSETGHFSAQSTMDNYTLCKGDSGSGFVANCMGTDSAMKDCLLGITSNTKHIDEFTCSSEVYFSDINHISNSMFISKYYDTMTYRCGD